MKNYFLYGSLLAIVMTSCTFSETKKDNQIDPLIKNQIHLLNSRIIDGMVEDRPDKVLAVSSDKLRERKGEIIMLAQVLKGLLKKDHFRVMNEYYQKNASKKHEGMVISGKNGDHDYQIRYEALNKEMYVLVGYFEDARDQKCFTFVYGKYGNDWKLNYMQAGILKIMNKDAFDWYRIAKSEYEKGYLIDALCHMGISSQLLKPANHQWQYQKEKEMEAFDQKVTHETYKKYSFPLTVNDVKTKPVIFRIYSQVIPEGYFPLILYTTTVDFNDVAKLSRECREIHDSIGKLFKGIDTNNKILLYRPMKSIPTGTDKTKQYGFKMMTK